MTLTQAEMDDLFTELPVSVQQAIARGDVAMQDVFERLTQPGTELCPHCGVREIPWQLRQVGICHKCFTAKMVEARHEILEALDNTRAINAMKTRVKRARLDQELNPRRHRERMNQVAVDLLRTLLADGPVGVEVIHATAKLLSIEPRRVQEAKVSEGVIRTRRQEGPLTITEWRYPEGVAEVPAPSDACEDEEEQPTSEAVPVTVPTTERERRFALIAKAESLPLVKCPTCGRTVRQHTGDESLCTYCQERAATKEATA